MLIDKQIKSKYNAVCFVPSTPPSERCLMASISQFPSMSFDDTKPQHVSFDTLPEPNSPNNNMLLLIILALVALMVFCYSLWVYKQVIVEHTENKLLLQENRDLTRRNVRLMEENAELTGTLLQVRKSQDGISAELKSILDQAQQSQ